ncbi:hypothetical protein [Ferruginibacter sp. SUN106]|uniref:hypothetical protein n=1 Tax=Ferruginibacter sp. SUN106 TaxID=2978348 RepID=UPI003D36F367
MKKYFTILALTIIVFVVSTMAAATIETPFDGNDTYGFPVTFYQKFSGMCDPCPPNPSEINFWNLCIDIVFCFLTALVIWLPGNYVLTKWRARKQTT